MSFSSRCRSAAPGTRTILVTLLIGFLSSGAELGRPGDEMLRQLPVMSEPSGPPQKTWIRDQMDQGDVRELRQRNLLLPVSGLRKENLRDSFNESRGNHIHEAIDVLALRNTPILAVEDGSIARLWYSVPGGLTIHQLDPRKEYEYDYAHLESYARGLKEGDPVQRGQVIGYVGTSGNAPKGTPHLHFTILKLTDSKHWQKGTPVNPYLVFR